MRNLSPKAIEEFKQLYLSERNVSLSDTDAQKLGIELLELFKVIYRPIPKTDAGLTFVKGSIPLEEKK